MIFTSFRANGVDLSCPKCGSSNISIKNMSLVKGKLSADVTCIKCGERTQFGDSSDSKP